MAKATFDKSRSLQLFARCNEAGVPKVLTFVNDDGTDHAIAAYDFALAVYLRASSPTALFTLTIGSGLTVQNTNELLIEITDTQATLDPDTYFYRLYSVADDNTWLNGPFRFHEGEFDGVDEDDTITITENGTAVTIEVTTQGSTISAATQSEVNTGTETAKYVSPATLQDKDDTAVALVDGATIDLTGPKHTLSTATGRTFTISHAGDDIVLVITLSATSATFTFPAAALCVADGTASGDNTLVITGATSGDKHLIAIAKVGSSYFVGSKNCGQ